MSVLRPPPPPVSLFLHSFLSTPPCPFTLFVPFSFLSSLFSPLPLSQKRGLFRPVLPLFSHPTPLTSFLPVAPLRPRRPLDSTVSSPVSPVNRSGEGWEVGPTRGGGGCPSTRLDRTLVDRSNVAGVVGTVKNGLLSSYKGTLNGRGRGKEGTGVGSGGGRRFRYTDLVDYSCGLRRRGPRDEKRERSRLGWSREGGPASQARSLLYLRKGPRPLFGRTFGRPDSPR